MSNSENYLFPNSLERDAGKPFCFIGSVVSDVGHIRLNNEDNFVLGRQWNRDCEDRKEGVFSAQAGRWYLLAVFDGMGGGEAGEVASATAAEVFINRFHSIETVSTREQIDEAMYAAFLEANNKILSLHGRYRIYGTTGTVLCTDGMVYKIFHLGDSRAYLFQKGELFLLTKDQTVAQIKMDLGIYDSSAPEAEAEKHQLTQFIGHDKTQHYLKPQESKWNSVTPGCMVLLCSDGLYDMCSTEEICNILGSSGEVQEQAAALVQRAKHNGGEDNITCLLAAFTMEEE